MKYQSTLGAVIGLASMAAAHMQMKSPPPLRSQYNEYTTDADYSMTSPLDQSGSNFPCKGYHSLLNTDQGKSVATWQPGSSQSMTITGGASHNGGSCQASLSYDGGSTWKVIHSYIGNCPVTGDSSYDFTVPSDAQSGAALFAWTWFNNVGNREMYMNCASVTIGGSSKRDVSAFSSLPDMFVANVGNGCSTVEGSDVEFPNPGTEVTNNSKKTSPPSGSCGSSGGGGNSPSSSASAAPSPTAQPTATQQPTSVQQPTSTKQPTTSASKPVTTPGASPTTTLQTVTKSSSAAASPTPTSGTPSGGFPQGQACTPEGEWNCVGGTQYQRCASGQWSALQAVYPGTTCTPGQSSELAVVRRSARSPRNLAEVVRSLWM